MNSEQAIERAKEIAEHFLAPTGESSWVPYLGFSGWRWSYDLLAQLVATVGDHDVLYATGHVSDDSQEPWARVALFTQWAAVEGGFSPERPDEPARAWVRAVGLSSLGAVRVLDAGPLSAPNGAWPLRLKVEVAYKPDMKLPPLALPIEPFTSPDRASALASYLPTLIAALDS